MAESNSTTNAESLQGELNLNYKTIRKRVMRRIYLVYIFERLTCPWCLKMYIFGVSMASIASLVSLGNVIANMPPVYELNHFSWFSIQAFMATEVTVQVLTVMALLAMMAFILPIERLTLRHICALKTSS